MVTSVSFTATTPYNAMGSPSSLTMQQQSPRQQKSQQPMPLQSQMQQNKNDEWFSDDDESVTPPASTTAYVLYDFEELSVTIQHKFLTGENIDEFDEFPAIHQYFPYQNFHTYR